MKRFDCLAADGRTAIIAIDHALYSWPCRGLEDRGAILDACAEAGVDGVIASYGTIRDFRSRFGAVKPILKLDLTTVTVGSHYLWRDNLDERHATIWMRIWCRSGCDDRGNDCRAQEALLV